MNNVVPIQSHRSHGRRPQQPTMAGVLIQAAERQTCQLDTTLLQMPVKTATGPAAKLDASLDEYRTTMLSLAHRRSNFLLEMELETNIASLKLEAAAHRAMTAGVPESEIYGLGEDMAEALSSAMNTVAGA